MNELPERYQAIVEAFDGHIYICSADLRIEYMNQQLIKRSGRDGTGELCYQVLHNLNEPCSWCVNERVMRGETVRWEILSPLDNRWYNVVNVPIRHNDGSISKQAMITDINDRKLAEEKTLESERHQRELADSLPIGIYEADLSGRLTFANPTGLTMFGYTEIPKDLHLLDTIAPQDRSKAAESMRMVLSGQKTPPNEYSALRTTGACFPVFITSLPLRDKNGQLIGYRGTILDITERKQIETAMQNAQRLESLGILAGGIAHDFNNLLTGIFSNIEMARVIMPQDSGANEFLNCALTSFSRAKDLTQQLLTFAKGGSPDIRAVSIATFLKETVLFSLSGSAVNAEFMIPDTIWPCAADASQVGQVVDNIVINARQAMPQGGTITVTVSNIAATDAPRLRLSAEPYIAIAISDCGTGIPAHIIGNIFDPFFTTKPSGSGLGLSMAYSIIKKHRGHIQVESELSRGTTFTIYIPASTTDSVPTEKQDSAMATVVNTTQKILIVDDEPNVRIIEARLLESMGYTTAQAHSGEEAIIIFTKEFTNKNRFDIVILDLNMPGTLSGEQTIKQLLAIDPAVRVVASSGDSGAPAITDPQRFGFKGMLKKPFTKEELENAVLSALA